MSDATTPSRGDGALTLAAVLNFVTAGLDFLGGGFFLAAWLFLNVLNVPFAILNTVQAKGGQPDPGLAPIARASLFLAVVGFVTALPKILAGVALLKRQRLGVQLGLVLAAVAALMTIVALAQFHLAAALWTGAYAALMFCLLLPYRSADFMATEPKSVS